MFHFEQETKVERLIPYGVLIQWLNLELLIAIQACCKGQKSWGATEFFFYPLSNTPCPPLPYIGSNFDSKIGSEFWLLKTALFCLSFITKCWVLLQKIIKSQWRPSKVRTSKIIDFIYTQCKIINKWKCNFKKKLFFKVFPLYPRNLEGRTPPCLPNMPVIWHFFFPIFRFDWGFLCPRLPAPGLYRYPCLSHHSQTLGRSL